MQYIILTVLARSIKGTEMRTYEQTHPWLKFAIDMRPAQPSLWILLGEAASKIEHLSKVPLRPATANRLHQLYLAKGVAATTAIEGNTLSEDDVLKAVEGQLQVPTSQAYLKQEVDNIIVACNDITQHMVTGNPLPLDTGTLCLFNRHVMENLPLSEDVTPGVLRRHSVVVGTVYRGAPAEDCRFLMERLCDWLAGPDFAAPKGMESIYAILKAIVTHLYLAWIHPFGDGNGRTARLAEFYILLEAGIPLPAAHLLSNHYNQTRSEYYRQLDYASKSGGDILPFIKYAVVGLVDGLRTQLDFIWTQHWDIVWRNYVHEIFAKKSGSAHARQRLLALELGAQKSWVPVQEIMDLTVTLAKAYAGKTNKTVQRDLNHLVELGLVKREPKRVRACRELIQAFLPVRKPDLTQ